MLTRIALTETLGDEDTLALCISIAGGRKVSNLA